MNNQLYFIVAEKQLKQQPNNKLLKDEMHKHPPNALFH